MVSLGTVSWWRLLHWSSCRWLCVSEAPLSSSTCHYQHRSCSERWTDREHRDPTEMLPNKTPHTDYCYRISTPPETGQEDTIHPLTEKNEFGIHQQTFACVTSLTKLNFAQRNISNTIISKINFNHLEDLLCGRVLNLRIYSKHSVVLQPGTKVVKHGGGGTA